MKRHARNWVGKWIKHATHEKANEERLKELRTTGESKESEGEVEILDAMTAKADFTLIAIRPSDRGYQRNSRGKYVNRDEN